MSKILTQRAIESAKPKPTRYGRPDGLIPGLQLVVQPSGAKTFRLLVRVHGKQINFTIGNADLMSLGEARTKARGILGEIAAGNDPREAKREAAAAAADTVARVARDFVRLHVKPNLRRSREMERQIEKELIPRLGSRPIRSIRKRDVVAMVDDIAARAPVMGNRVFATTKQLFGWAVARDVLEVSPLAGVKKPASETPRDRRHNDHELSLIWRAIGTLRPPYVPFGSLVRLLILTGARRDEVGRMQWSEINADGTMWTLPASRAKNGNTHSIPLSPLARSILMAKPRRPTEADGFVFPSRTGAFNDYARGKAALDEAVTELADDGQPIPHWVLHDFRRTVASGMAKLKIQLPVVEKILNHTSGTFSGVQGIYQLYSFDDEKRQALEVWSAHVLSLDTRSNVISLRA
jgi:integrase